jgi:MFS transporter, CP family, cyanate transporter
VLLVTGVLALGYNLRGSITSLPPVFPELQDSLRLSAATVSVLAATPVICFGVVSGFAAALARRAGEERVLFAAMAALVAGLVARGAAPSVLLFPGTILASGAIAVMNVLLSSLIKRRWPERAGLLIGLYITALSAGAIVASLVSVPLWQASGGSVVLTLGWLAGPAALGALIWLPQGRAPDGVRPAPDGKNRRRIGRAARPSPGGTTVSLHGGHPPPVPPGRTPRLSAFGGRGSPETTPARMSASGGAAEAAASPVAPVPRVPVHRYALAWYVTIFMGMQSLLYYAALSWLPTMLRDRGVSAGSAGDLLALMGVGNLTVSLIIPVVAQRMRSQLVLVVPTVIALATGLAGLLYAPLGGAVGWALLLGAGQNAALALAIFFTAARTPHAAAAASLSALAQSVGYLLAAAGPLEVGLLHSATGSWTAPVAVLFALTGVLLVSGVLAARPGMLPAGPDPAERTGRAPAGGAA